MAPPFDSLLTLRPAVPADTDAIRTLLEQPGLARRTLFPGITEVHPVEWNTDRRTFGVRLDEDLFGAVDLRRDDDEPTRWELSIVLADHKRSYDGARSALAGLAYAFDSLRAQAVWFWVPSDNRAIRAFADQVGFMELHSIRLPSGDAGTVFELGRPGWQSTTAQRLEMFFEHAVQIQTDEGIWHGSKAGFTFEG